jgi:hypothetical protein
LVRGREHTAERLLRQPGAAAMGRMLNRRGDRAGEWHGYRTSDRERVAHVTANVVWLVRRMYVVAWGR